MSLRTDNQAKLQSEFKAAMLKLSVLGQNMDNMIDCSEVIPIPPALVGDPHLPAGFDMESIQQAVSLPAPYNSMCPKLHFSVIRRRFQL